VSRSILPRELFGLGDVTRRIAIARYQRRLGQDEVFLEVERGLIALARAEDSPTRSSVRPAKNWCQGSVSLLGGFVPAHQA